ncbi:MAG: hypothetical protein NTV46_01390 [Verrucomicrobia bacterium]|nr:hypothetical protein [Verrucomicrobiota bacterium]
MSDGFIRFTTKLKGGSDVARLLNRYPEKVGRTLLSLVKQEARGLAVELARNTRPFGFSEKAKKRGEKAVAGDIVKVFALPSDAYDNMRLLDPAAADGFWANIQNRRFSKAEKALQSSNSNWKDLSVGRLDPKIHQQSRTGKNANVKRKEPAQIVTSPKALDSYIAKIQKRVGFAKIPISPKSRSMSVSPRVRGSTRPRPSVGVSGVPHNGRPGTNRHRERPQSRPARNRPSRSSTSSTTSNRSRLTPALRSRSRWRQGSSGRHWPLHYG